MYSLQDKVALSDAIDANNYAGVPADMQDTITEERFASMVERVASKEAVTASIENGDYAAFQETADERMLSKIDSEEDFNEATQKYSDKQAYIAELDQAVIDNDFTSYQATSEAQKAQKEADWHTCKGRHADLSDEEMTAKLQERFDEKVAYYQENGELPSIHKFRWRHRGMKGLGGKGGRDSAAGNADFSDAQIK